MRMQVVNWNPFESSAQLNFEFRYLEILRDFENEFVYLGN